MYPASLIITQSALSGLPEDISGSLEKIQKAAGDLQETPMDLTGGIHQLHGAVKVLSSRLEDVDSEGKRSLHQTPFKLVFMDFISHASPQKPDPPISSGYSRPFLACLACYRRSNRSSCVRPPGHALRVIPSMGLSACGRQPAQNQHTAHYRYSMAV